MSRDDSKILVTGPSPRGWHRLQLAAECLQKYAWAYERPREELHMASRPALAIGSLVHLALAQHYKRMQFEQEGKDPEDYCEPEEAVVLIARLQGIERFVPAVVDTYRAYIDFYAQDAINLRIVDVEVLFDGTVAGHRLTGRIDLLYEDLGGRLWACDHKCEPADARVLTPSGPMTVGELVEAGSPWTCCSWDGKATCWAEALAPVDAGVQDVYQLALADGTKERHGYRHPLLTDGGWKEVQHVQPGDWIAVAPPPDLPEADIPDDALRVLGLALSDGGRVQGNSSYVITAHDEEVREFLQEALDNLGDPWSLCTLKGEPQGVRLLRGGGALGLCEKWGISTTLSKERVFPSELLALSRRQAGVLLGSLWEGDGAAYLSSPSRSGKRPVRIVFSSRSLSMAQGVRHLLMQQGILSNLAPTRIKGSPCYQVVVVGYESKMRFLRDAMAGKIGCPASVVGGRKTRKGRVLEDFPTLFACQQEGRAFREKLDYDCWDYPGRGRTNNPHLEAGVRWVEAKSNICVGRERCYDIEVPAHHTFLSGGCVITHNTTARLTARHKEFYAISGQMFGYQHLVRQKYGDRLAGMKLNLIQHTNPKFLRLTLERSPFLEQSFEQSVDDIEKSIERLRAEGRSVDQWPKAMSELTCMHRYGACDFIDLCRFGAEARKAGAWEWVDE